MPFEIRSFWLHSELCLLSIVHRDKQICFSPAFATNYLPRQEERATQILVKNDSSKFELGNVWLIVLGEAKA